MAEESVFCAVNAPNHGLSSDLLPKFYVRCGCVLVSLIFKIDGIATPRQQSSQGGVVHNGFSLRGRHTGMIYQERHAV
jgi:hypothetical protein